MTHATYRDMLPPLLNFRGSGRGGVILFFFLSAFLLSGPFLRRPERALRWREWAAYGVRRVCRIVPLYYGIVLLFFALRFYPFDDKMGLSVAFRHLSFQLGMGVFWTIVVEMRFYAVLPVLLIGIGIAAGRIRMGRLLVLLVGSTWVVGAALGLLGSGVVLKLGIGGLAPVFIAGMLSAAAVNRLSARRWGRGPGIGFECLAWLSAIVFIWLSVPSVYYAVTTGASIASYAAASPVYEAFWAARTPWIGLILGCLFVSLPNGIGLLRRALSWPALVWAGRISFGMYLIHVNVLNGIGRTDLPGFLQFPFAALATLALADLLHRLIETPAMAAGGRIASGLVARRAQ